VAKPRPIEGLDCGQAYAGAAAKVVAVRSQELADHSRGVLDLGDIERVHDIPQRHYDEALRELKAIADALGERRDADVAIGALERFAAGLAAPDRPGVEGLTRELRAEQAGANARLEAFVEPRRLAVLSERLAELVAAAEATGSEATG
jgi:CHAD domain-containing protein